MSPSLVATVWAMSMLQRRRAGEQEAADETLDRRIAEVQREREIEEQEGIRRTSVSTRARSVPRQLEAGIRRLELGPPAEPGRRDEHEARTQGTQAGWPVLQGDGGQIGLTASPLEKLRLKPEAPGLAEHFARVEQRGISMLLECMGEPLRQEVIASRRTTAVDILFRLFTMCQPGVGERTSLLRGITDVKVPAGMADVFNAIRIWRRSAGRSEEVNVTVDPLALAGVLAKFADSVAKLGGSQVAFRLATMRQQLDVDRAPKLDAVKDWAELEELSKAQSVAKLAQPHRPWRLWLVSGKERRGRHRVSSGERSRDVAEVNDARLHMNGDPWRNIPGVLPAHRRPTRRRIVHLWRASQKARREIRIRRFQSWRIPAEKKRPSAAQESAKKREPEAAKEKAAVGEAKEEQNQQKPIESRIQVWFRIWQD